ncbi:MAG: hypothetical protein R2758_08315 [Bacteroidales bacterium]
MKKFISTTILTVLMASAAVAGRQDYPEEYLGLPGDNLNLYAVMKLFQESETLEAFERSLNDEDSRINNLDLNNDGYVDYLTVTDYPNGDVHTIVMRSVLDRNEYQDVAVFTVEKLRNGEVQIQLIGDEALYGRNYIVEPIYAETPNPGYRGRTVQRENVTVVTTTYYEVAAWPMISFIYSPRYVVWRSNWYWGYYPVYYRPWRPLYWHYYYGYHYHWYPTYYSYYRHWDHPRYHHYHDYYYRSVRAYSPNVSQRITAGTYKQTYSRPETRRDGEALYASTHGTRSSGARPEAVSGSDRRSSAATGSRSSGSPAAVQNGESRRVSTGATRSSTVSNGRNGTAPGTTGRSGSSASSNSRSSTSPGTTGRSGSSASSNSRSSTAPGSADRSSKPATGNDQAASRRTVQTEKKSQATVQRSTQTSATRSQGTVQRSTQTSATRSQGTVQRSTQSSSSRSQATVQRTPSSQKSVSQKSSSSSSQRSSAPAARSQSKSSSQGRSSSAPSQSKSSSKGSSKSSSKGSDDKKSSRR